MNYKKYMTEFTTALEDLELNNPVEPTAPELSPMMRRFRNMPTSGLGCIAWYTPNVLKWECLKSHQQFQSVNQDCIGLFVMIKSIVHTFEE